MGSNPVGLAYDSGRGEIMAVNAVSDDMSVITDSTATVNATVGVGSGPDGVAYDAGRGEVFVANSGSDNVTVINDSTDSVSANVPVGSAPVGIAYDSGRSELFVANTGSNTVSVISDSNNTVVATVTAGYRPYAAAYDAGVGEVFVANYNSNNVSVISDTTNLVVATVAVGSGPAGVGYDPGRGTVFVANLASDNVSVISDTTDAVDATVPVGTQPVAFAFDSSAAAMFVANSVSNNVSLISDASNTVVANIPVGARPYSIAYDSGLNEAYTANYNSNNVTVISGGRYATTFFAVTRPELALTPASGIIGSTVAANGTGFASNATITLSSAGSSVGSTCATDSNGSFPGTTGTSCSFKVPAGAHGRIVISASDGSNIANESFGVDSSVAVSPTAGIVGTLVAANGSGFAPNSGVALSLGGVPVGGTCATDTNGSFPVAGGAACTFTVPAVAGGAEPVVAASAWNSSASVGVGTNPVCVAYDSADGDVFAGNAGSGTVSVVSDTTGAPIATISVGSSPDGIAFDSGRDEVFVANSGSNSVSVISGSTDTVTAMVYVGFAPVGIAYDSGQGEVFVANSGSDTVSVISDATNAVVANVTTGSRPYAVAYDSGRGELFVANYNSNNVSIISDSTDSVIATVAVGTGPAGVAYDPTLGEVFVANLGSNNLSLISDVANTLSASIPVGAQPVSFAYDPQLQEMFVADSAANNVSVISDAADTVVATLPVGAHPYSATFDSGLGEVFTANYYSNNLSIILGADPAEALFSVSSGIELLPSTGGVDVGQTVTVEGSGFGGSLPIRSFTVGSTPVLCTSATVGQCVGGVLTTAPSGAIVAGFNIPAVPSSGSYVVTITDTANNTGTALLDVFTAPLVTQPLASPGSVDIGQSTTLTSSASLGSGNYSYAWVGLPTGCAGAGASVNCTPTTSGRFGISVRVTDSNGISVTSSPLNLTVYPDPTIASPLASVLSGQVDGNQSVTFTATASSGSLQYVSFSWSGLPGGCGGTTDSVTCSGASLPAGDYLVSASVTDSNDFQSPTSGPLSFTVLGDPTVSLPAASAPSGDTGQEVTFSTQAASGSGNFVFSWLGLPSGCGGTGDVVQCSLTKAGVSLVRAVVTDSNGFTIASLPLSFTSYSDPFVNLSASWLDFDQGQTVTLNATPGLGSGGYTYGWKGLPTGCSGSTSTVDCSPAASGRYSVSVKVTDSSAVSVLSPALVLVVAPRLSGTLSANPATPESGAMVSFVANATGGTGPFAYAWAFGDRSEGSGPMVNHTFITAGTYPVTLWINDSGGGSIEARTNLTVLAGTPGVGGSSLAIYLAIGGIAVVIAALVLFRRRNRKNSGEGEDPRDEESPGYETPETLPEPSQDGAVTPDGEPPTLD